MATILVKCLKEISGDPRRCWPLVFGVNENLKIKLKLGRMARWTPESILERLGKEIGAYT
jgi:hypothetical protein